LIERYLDRAQAIPVIVGQSLTDVCGLEFSFLVGQPTDLSQDIFVAHLNTPFDVPSII